MKLMLLLLLSLVCALGYAEGEVVGQAAPNTSDLSALVHPFVYFTLIGLAGMFAHYLKKWQRGEIKGGFLDYFVLDHGKASLAAVTGFIGAAITMTITHQLDGLNTLQLLMLGFTTGFGFDSAINKSSPPP